MIFRPCCWTLIPARQERGDQNSPAWSMSRSTRRRALTIRTSWPRVTLNRHWFSLSRLWPGPAAGGVKLNELDFSPLLSKEDQVCARRSTDTAVDSIQEFFKLPIFTGCQGFDLRKRKDGSQMYLPGPHIFHRAAYFGPMIAHYHGFRREEFCGLAIQDIDVEGVSHPCFRDPGQ